MGRPGQVFLIEGSCMQFSLCYPRAERIFSLDELNRFSADGSMLLSHASHKVPGVELSTGSLGHALPVACGVALAAMRNKKSWRTFVMLSDGELDEGSNWEAFLFAAHHKLSNLICIVDFNKIQSLGNVKDVINLDPLSGKFRSFNWHVVEIDGHNHTEIRDAFDKAKAHEGAPIVIVAHTTKGKGVDFMEDKLLWHYRPPSGEQLSEALKQVKR